MILISSLGKDTTLSVLPKSADPLLENYYNNLCLG